MTETSLSQADKDMIFNLAQELTGTATSAQSRHEVIILNVLRRIQTTGCSSLKSYLDYITQNGDELDHLISAVTIHTTSWFREMPHYRAFEESLKQEGANLIGRTIRILSAACSTGEELFSLGCILENFRRQYIGFDYELFGIDIDPVSIAEAERAMYKIDNFDAIPRLYRHYFMLKEGNRYSVDKQIQRRTRFMTGNLNHIDRFQIGKFDTIFCRNALIYFTPEQTEDVVKRLLKLLADTGHLTLGHCESITTRKFSLVGVGNSTYVRESFHRVAVHDLLDTPIKVLIVDDSPSVRLWVTGVLGAHDILCDSVESAEKATLYLKSKHVDLVILDMNMPGQNGLSWLHQQRSIGFRTPVVIFTDVEAADAPQILDALDGPAQDYINKTWASTVTEELVDRIRTLALAGRSRSKVAVNTNESYIAEKTQRLSQLDRPDIILVGASTGGTEALSILLEMMPKDCPPVVCVQHIPVEFAEAFFRRLAASSSLKLGEVKHGKPILDGHLYMPTQDFHLGVHQKNDELFCLVSNAEKISMHRPSVDFLFQSASFLHNKQVIAILLTGMGKDGARGLLELRNHGAYTMAQDEGSSVVWGMPGEAVRIGAVKLSGNLRDLHDAVYNAARKKSVKKSA